MKYVVADTKAFWKRFVNCEPVLLRAYAAAAIGVALQVTMNLTGHDLSEWSNFLVDGVIAVHLFAAHRARGKVSPEQAAADKQAEVDALKKQYEDALELMHGHHAAPLSAYEVAESQ